MAYKIHVTRVNEEAHEAPTLDLEGVEEVHIKDGRLELRTADGLRSYAAWGSVKVTRISGS